MTIGPGPHGGAFSDGWDARESGLSREIPDGVAREFRQDWLDGWDAADGWIRETAASP